jgi:chaperone modulatory protein CbpM
MKKRNLIPANDFCMHYHISFSFLTGLEEAGLIRTVMIEEQSYLEEDDLVEVEKLVKLHTDLEINIEGIEAISHMLQRMKDMQEQVRMLRQRLRLYEKS